MIKRSLGLFSRRYVDLEGIGLWKTRKGRYMVLGTEN